MPCRIQEQPHIVLWLEAGQDRPGRHRLRRGRVQIVDLEVQMHRHLRITRPGRPHRRHVTPFSLKRQCSPTVNSPTVSGPTVSGPTVSGPTVSGPTVSGPTASGPTASGPTVS